MYRKIIVGFNDSDGSHDALALAELLAQSTGAQLILTCVFPDDPFPSFAPAERPQAEETLARKVQDVADKVGAAAEAFPGGSPAHGLRNAIEELGGDLVVVGSSSRRGVGRILAGDVALQLLHGSSCAVAVAPAGLRKTRPALKTIGIGFDGSSGSKEALAVAVELGISAGATLSLLGSASVVETGEAVWADRIYSRKGAIREGFQASLDQAVEALPRTLRPCARLLEGGPVAALAAEAESLDLLCVGSHGYGPLGRVLLDSVSAGLVKTAPCPLLVVPHGAAVAQSESAATKSAA